ncbi:hedgehog-interacting protein precursor [Danio rerio]|uniref:Hedgehog-interacting protein n=1 Tax=Danio rerio TaxID=7955 RepID=A1A5I0_DANRE|nr:hedgehog-interacting protein precursor [Danio rerio]AAI28660.1 Hedgehog interacting protein [Danio rerio]|eukprot:NP_001073481.1 hedgehog-interacting protein precursor [Danio rerio]
MKHLKFVLLLAIAANFWECGDAKFGEKGELSPRRRRCYDGSLPRRLKKKERKLSLEGSGGGEVCHRLYPRVSCCPSRRAPYQILHRKDARTFSTNNTECSRLLEEIKCAHCSPNAQMLFHSPKLEKAPHREQDLPHLCHDYCQEFYYTCRGHVPELFQADVDEFCQYYGRMDGGLCFPDFHRKQLRRDSNYLLDEKTEAINRKHKHNCYCAQEIHSGLQQPVGVVHCGDGSQRLFILEREGFVWILTHDMELLKEPFLDIHKLVQSGLKGGDERGLLSLAFHPNYKKNGKLYVSYTTNQERWTIGPHDHILRVVEYTVSRKNPNQVDTRTPRVLMEVAELHRKHLGGQLLFGPDGLLHIFLGDGMITLDNMEEMDGLSDFTGSVLRVDVDTECCSTPYSIPRNNPYFNSTNQPPEIFAHGLHDPGRCAVDKLRMDTNGSLLILCTDTVGKNTTTGRILQVIKGKDYENEPSMFDLGSSGGTTPVGGFIYRGCQSRRLYGSYVFGDKNGNFRILQRPLEDRLWQEKPLCLGTSSSCGSSLVGHILGFGEDELGEVYILVSSKSTAKQSHGKIYKLVDPKRPQVPKECRRPVEDPEMLSTACSRECKNGHCTPTGKCCCNAGWEGPFCLRAKCELACRNGGVCVEPNKCLCKEGFSGNQCSKGERGTKGDGEKDSILEHIIDMTTYLLDLTSYIV